MAPRSDITVTLACNSRSAVCPRTHERGLLDARLRAVRAYSTSVLLTGVEITSPPDVVALVERCRTQGFEQIGMTTNGRSLADRELAKRLVEAGLTEVHLPVHDLRPSVHDALTGASVSLPETLSGIDSLLAVRQDHPRLQIGINTLLCTLNVDGVHALLQELTGRGLRHLQVTEMLLSEAFPDALPHTRVLQLVREVGANPLLASAQIEWRGLPLCLLSEVPGEQVHPHDIATKVVDEPELESHFEAYFRSFVRPSQCDGCCAADRCLGLQRRYFAQHGAALLRPLAVDDEQRALAAAAAEISGFPARRAGRRLEVNLTTACAFRCTYCAVSLGQADASHEVVDRAVDLLLTSKSERVELQFFGGEPLLRRQEVLRTMAYGAERARQVGKQLGFVITTNGLTLDEPLLRSLREFDVEVLFSLDGPPEVMRRYRPLHKPGGDAAAIIERNLALLIDSGVDYFVNLVVTPDAVGDLQRRVAYIADLGVHKLQICYAIALGWTDEAQQQYCEALRACAEMLAARPAPGCRLQNIGSAAEPTVLSHDLIVDVDGTLYDDVAIFSEKVLPGLRRAQRLGHVLELDSFDELAPSREQNLVLLRRAYPDPASPERRLVEQQLVFGWRIHETLEALPPGGQTAAVQGPAAQAPSAQAPAGPAAKTRPSAERSAGDDGPLQHAVLRRSLAQQARVVQRRPDILKIPLLMLESSAKQGCLYGLARPTDPSDFVAVARWLADNRRLGLKQLGIGGNEPLAHPQIDAILAEARACGFAHFDALSSGAPVADAARARAFQQLGVSAYTIPLYGADAETHDAITQLPGSHAQALRGIDNLRALGATIHIYTTVLRQNLDALAELEALVREAWGLPLCAIPVRPNAADQPFDLLTPRYRDVVSRAGVSCLTAFPLCIAKQVQEAALPDQAIISDLLKIYVLDQPFIKPSKCGECSLRQRCSGTFQAYLELHGDEELVVQ